MAEAVPSPAPLRVPVWLKVLAVYSLLLGIITWIPEVYLTLYGLHLVDIGPHSNPLGQVWYWFNFNGETGYIKLDSGFWAGAVLDSTLLGPLYIICFYGLWTLRRWVIPAGLIVAALLFYGVMLLIISDLYSNFHDVTNNLSYWLSNLPYVIYPIWMVYTLTARRALFTR
jgi:hypothetical protein